MKVVTSQTMAKTEKWAFTELDYSPSEWMQLAGTGVASVVERFAEENLLQSAATIIAGKGNNAGDGFVAARILASRGWHLRIALLVKKEDLNSLAAEEAKKCADAGLIIEEISSKQDLIKFASMSNEAVFIDALFGTGFKGEVEGIFVDAIEFLNSLPNPVISIDVPSGMSGTTGPNQKHIIQADLTIAIGLPKAGYFIANGWDYVRRIELVDVLMPMEAIDKMESDLEWFTYAEARTLLPYLKPTRNKYSRGFLGIVAGSKGLYGAAKLTSMGALRAGAGIIKLPYPANASQEMAGMPVEIVGVPLKERPQAQLSSDDTVEIAASLEKADAIVIGPGLSRDAVAGTLIKNLVDRLQGKKFVFDADALNHLADGAFVPPAGSILTPHSGEMMRLLGVTDHDKFLRDFRVLCSEYALSLIHI